MKLLFLRGQVPKDRDPRQIMFDTLDECDDMWTQLARELSKDDYGEVWYWGGKRKVKYAENFVERWVPNFDKTNLPFQPDVIFARGGFPAYDGILGRTKSFKIYYGAGRRHVPQNRFKAFDLILTDSPRQLADIQKVSKSPASLFPKPAAENIFRPTPSQKAYDVIFIGNEAPDDKKGHKYALSSIPPRFSVVCVGIASSKLRKKFPHIHFTGWIPRKRIPEYYGKSKVALVTAAKVDSCPRVIPESLACNCPLLVLESVRFWKEKYITPTTGVLFDKRNLAGSLSDMLSRVDEYQPYEYYKNNLSLSVSAQYIRNMIK